MEVAFGISKLIDQIIRREQLVRALFACYLSYSFSRYPSGTEACYIFYIKAGCYASSENRNYFQCLH